VSSSSSLLCEDFEDFEDFRELDFAELFDAEVVADFAEFLSEPLLELLELLAELG
jgi:hypothetical protein